MKRYDSYKDSGVKWIGEIPSHWRVLKNKYFLKQEMEKSESGDEELLSVSEHIGIVPRKSIRTEGELSRSESLVGYLKVQKGQLVSNIMLTWKRGLGVSDFSGIVSPAYSVFSFSNSYPKYYHYLFRTNLYSTEFKKSSKGVIESRLRLYDDSFFRLFSHFPPLPEQQQIVSFLDSKTSQIDELIQKKERKIELLKEYRTSLINQVVTKGLNPNVEMKDSGVEWIGGIPSHWEVKKIKHLFRHTKGRNGQKLTKEYIGENEGEYPVYSGSTKGNGELGRVNEYEFNTREETVIFVSTVGSDTTVMSTRILSGKFNLSQNCLIMSKRIEVNIRFVHFFTLMDFPYQRSLLPVILKEGHRSVGMGELDEFQVLFPPLSEQEQIVSHLDEQTHKIDSSIQSEEKKIELLKEYRQSLISEVVTGKIDVRLN